MAIPFEQTLSDNSPHIAVSQIVAGDLAGQSMPRKVQKTWGYELHYHNDDRYCMKMLVFEGPAADMESKSVTDSRLSTSMHFHVQKHETLLVVEGTLTLTLILNKKEVEHKLTPGMAWVVCPGHVHRLSALDGPVRLVEASTFDRDDDSVRVA